MTPVRSRSTAKLAGRRRSGFAVEEGSDWGAQLYRAAGCLAHLGIHSAPALGWQGNPLGWQGNLYTGLGAM